MILAPENIVELAAGCWLTLSLWTHGVQTGSGDDAINDFTGRKNNFSDDFSAESHRLQAAIRLDLGVDEPTA